jgi:hypothetical protein
MSKNLKARSIFDLYSEALQCDSLLKHHYSADDISFGETKVAWELFGNLNTLKEEIDNRLAKLEIADIEDKEPRFEMAD